MNEKTIITPQPEEESRQIYLLQAISNRIAVVSRRILAVEDRLTEMERDRDTYRRERNKQDVDTLDIIKKEIQQAAEGRELKTWSIVKDRALYVGIALLIAWLIQFIK